MLNSSVLMILGQFILVLLPILIVILSITVFHRSTRVSMLIGSCAALCIAMLNGMNCHETASGTWELLISTLIDNWSLYVSLLVFGLYVYTITRSSAVDGLSGFIQMFTSSRLGFVICTIFCVLLFSSDDYLDCIIVCMALSATACHYGISSVRFTVIVNMLVASACTLLPSTWRPVITASMADTGMAESGWQMFAFFPMVSLLLVLGYAVSDRFALRRNQVSDNPAYDNSVSDGSRFNGPGSDDPNSCASEYSVSERMSVIGIGFSAILLIGSFVLFSMLDFAYPLLAANVLALIGTVGFFTLFHLISPRQLPGAWAEGLSVMGNLDLTLVCVWLFTGIMTSLLHMDQVIVMLLNQFSVPVWLLPMMYFLASAVFGYLSSSAFACFRLMLPLAAAASALCSESPELIPIIAGAAISGSLFASHALTSDTLVLSSQSAGCNISEAFLLQMRYSIVTLLTGSLAYLICGYLTMNASVIAGLLASVAVICFLVLAATAVLKCFE